MGSKKRIKPPKSKRGKNIKVPDAKSPDLPEIDYPIFCLKHLHKDYNLTKCDKIHHSQLLQKFRILSTMTWNQISTSPRHGLGYEKISIDSIKPQLPVTFTEDVTFLLAFRYNGKRPFLAHRGTSALHVFYIDHNFSVYNH